MIVIYFLAGWGALSLACCAGFGLLLWRDMRRMRRTRLIKEGRPLNRRQRRDLERLERDVDSSGS